MTRESIVLANLYYTKSSFNFGDLFSVYEDHSWRCTLTKYFCFHGCTFTFLMCFETMLEHVLRIVKCRLVKLHTAETSVPKYSTWICKKIRRNTKYLQIWEILLPSVSAHQLAYRKLPKLKKCPNLVRNHFHVFNASPQENLWFLSYSCGWNTTIPDF